MRIKNKEIAQILGISTTAVSLAIHNRPGVSADTRAKVLQLLNQSSTEDTSAIPLSQAGNILLSIHKKTGNVINEKPFFSNLVETIQQEAISKSYNLTIAHYTPEQDLQKYIDYINSLSIEGLVLMATEIDSCDLQYYKQLSVPIVLLDCTFDLEDIDSVALDNQTAIYRAFDYAYKMGHRNIGFLKGTPSINNFKHHLDGFEKAVFDYNARQYEHPVISLPCSIEAAQQEMNRFLAHPPKGFSMPSLFLADLDYIAIGAMQALKEHGYRIPDDVSLIGYDDVALCEFTDPPLTTTRVNRNDIGRIAVNQLINRIRNKHLPCTTTQVSSDLIIRQSVRRLS